MAQSAVPAAELTIAQGRRSLAQAFRDAGLDSADLDARLLIGHALGLDHAALIAQGNRTLEDREIADMHTLAARRLDREPVARILGVKEFWGLTLRINDATLVPRPETETVVEAALTAVDAGGARTRALRIADLGTGSGALLLALLTELPNATGIGTDISRQALDTAQANADSLGLGARAELTLCDFSGAMPHRFDLIVSNPPYVKSSDIATLPPEVRRDPQRALDGGADGLACYRTIVEQSHRQLNAGGHLVVELGAGQELAVTSLFRSAGLSTSPARTDLAGIPRALTGMLPQ